MSYENKILYGFSDIKIDEKLILGGKSVEVNIESESVKAYSERQDFVWSRINSASGRLTLLSLTNEEMELIFGYKTVKGCLEITDDLKNKEVELSFARTKASGKKVIYKMRAVFSPFAVSANTREGNIQEDVVTLDFEVIKHDGVYYRQIENI